MIILSKSSGTLRRIKNPFLSWFSTANSPFLSLSGSLNSSSYFQLGHLLYFFLCVSKSSRYVPVIRYWQFQTNNEVPQYAGATDLIQCKLILCHLIFADFIWDPPWWTNREVFYGHSKPFHAANCLLLKTYIRPSPTIMLTSKTCWPEDTGNSGLFKCIYTYMKRTAARGWL